MDCKLTLQGCKKCSSSIVCGECDSTFQWELSGSTTTCKCAVGFYVDGVYQDAVCQNCATPNPGCTECSSATDCTKCDHLTFWESDNSGKCKCRGPNYAVKPVSKLTCHLCRHFIPGCEECLSATNCKKCSAAQFWKLDTAKCVCDESHFPSTDGQTCLPCKNNISGCKNCDTGNDCMLCDYPGNWKSKDRGCVCEEGFFKQGDLATAVCVDCKLTLQGCKNCGSSTVCDEC